MAPTWIVSVGFSFGSSVPLRFFDLASGFLGEGGTIGSATSANGFFLPRAGVELTLMIAGT